MLAEQATAGSAVAETSAADTPAGARSPWWSLVVVAAGLFLAVVSTTVVSVALPTTGRQLHTGATGLEWTVDAYVVVYASLLIAGGVLGDRRGRKGLFLTGSRSSGSGRWCADWPRRSRCCSPVGCWPVWARHCWCPAA